MSSRTHPGRVAHGSAPAEAAGRLVHDKPPFAGKAGSGDLPGARASSSRRWSLAWGGVVSPIMRT